MKYQLFVALRYLRAKHKQVFTSVITVISALGIAIGVMALVVALSLMTGMHDQIRDNILGSRAHITLYGGSTERSIVNFEKFRDKILAIDGVAGAAPLVREEGMLYSQLDNQGVIIFGVDPEQSRDVIAVFDHVVEGDWRTMDKKVGEFGRRGILIGKELARTLGLKLNDDVIVMIATGGRLSPIGPIPRRLNLRVAGIFDTGDWQADSLFCYVPLRYLQETLKIGDSITMMQIKLDDLFKAPEMKEVINDAINGRYMMYTWIEQNASFFGALQLEKLAMFLTIALIVTVAALNIISSLIMLVMEKNRDIGVLMSMGATSGGIMTSFMLQGVIIGMIGTTVGAVLGIALSSILDYFELIKLPGDIYMISSIHFKIVPADILVVCAVAMGISLVATIYPAWKASRLKPAEALRYE